MEARGEAREGRKREERRGEERRQEERVEGLEEEAEFAKALVVAQLVSSPHRESDCPRDNSGPGASRNGLVGWVAWRVFSGTLIIAAKYTHCVYTYIEGVIDINTVILPLHIDIYLFIFFLIYTLYQAECE